MSKSVNFFRSILFAFSGIAFIFLNISNDNHIAFALALSVVFLVFSFLLNTEIKTPNYKNKTVLIFSVLTALSASGSFCHTMISSRTVAFILTPLVKTLNISSTTPIITVASLVASILSIPFCNCVINLILKTTVADKSTFQKCSTKNFYIALLIITFCVLLFSSNLSPLNSATVISDESIFAAIGKGWSKGLLPYSEMFDHKGPIIFFIYFMSELITKSTLLVFVLHVFSVWTSLIIGYRTVLKFINHKAAIACCFTMAFYLFILHIEYALTEVFCLPILMASGYFMFSYLFTEQKEHPPVAALCYGLLIAFSLGTRLTNCVVICVGVLVIFVDLIIKKQYTNLIKNICLGVVGIIFPILPFVIYFYVNGALYDAVYGTVIHNIFYALEHRNLSWHSILFKLYLLLPLICINTIVFMRKANTKIKIFVLLSSVLAAYCVAGGAMYQHYFIILIPYFPMLFSLIKSTALNPDTLFTKKSLTQIKCFAIIVVIICSLTIGIKLTTQKDSTFLEKSKTLVSKIPEDERDSVIAYNVNASWYLKTDILPCYKYFILQEFQSSKSKSMLKENIEFYNSAKAEWIIVNGNIYYDEIEEAIEANYTKVEDVPISKRSSLKLYNKNK